MSVQQKGEPAVITGMRFRITGKDPASRERAAQDALEIAAAYGLQLAVHDHSSESDAPLADVFITGISSELTVEEAALAVTRSMHDAGHRAAAIVRMPGGITGSQIKDYAYKLGVGELVSVERTGLRRMKTFVIAASENGTREHVNAFVSSVVGHFGRFDRTNTAVVPVGNPAT